MRLLNSQYTDFILSHVIRPYQGMLGYEQRIERLMFVSTTEPASFNYADLLFKLNSNREWFDLVINRLSRCYEAIDFSFFPDEAFAQELMKSLILVGVKPITYYSNFIYDTTF